MTKPSESPSTFRDWAILSIMFVVALLLTIWAIAGTWSAINQLPSAQYQRLVTSTGVEAALKQANTSRSQVAKRAQWLTYCGYEFERGLLKRDLSGYPSRNVLGALNVLLAERDGFAGLYALGFRLLALDRSSATAVQKWNALGPQIRALQKLELIHGQQDLFEFWRRVYHSVGLSTAVASMAADEHIRFPHNAWLVFMDQQFTELAAELDESDAAVVQNLHRRLLYTTLSEPAPIGLRALAAERFGASDLLPTELAAEAQALAARLYADSESRASSVAYNAGLLGGGSTDRTLVTVFGHLLVLSIVLAVAGLVTFTLLLVSIWETPRAPLGIGISFLIALPVIVAGWFMDGEATATVMLENLRRPAFSWGDQLTWWRLPWQPFAAVLIGILFTVVVFFLAAKFRTRGVAVAMTAWLVLGLSWAVINMNGFTSARNSWRSEQHAGVNSYYGNEPSDADRQLFEAVKALLE